MKRTDKSYLEEIELLIAIIEKQTDVIIKLGEEIESMKTTVIEALAI